MTMDHVITVRDVLIASGMGFVICALIVGGLWFLNALNTDL